MLQKELERQSSLQTPLSRALQAQTLNNLGALIFKEGDLQRAHDLLMV